MACLPRTQHCSFLGFHWFPLVSIFWFKSIGILFADSSFLSDFRSHLSAKWMPFLLMEPVWNPLKTTSEEPFLHRRSVRRLLAELGATLWNMAEREGVLGFWTVKHPKTSFDEIWETRSVPTARALLSVVLSRQQLSSSMVRYQGCDCCYSAQYRATSRTCGRGGCGIRPGLGRKEEAQEELALVCSLDNLKHTDRKMMASGQFYTYIIWTQLRFPKIRVQKTCHIN